VQSLGGVNCAVRGLRGKDVIIGTGVIVVLDEVTAAAIAERRLLQGLVKGGRNHRSEISKRACRLCVNARYVGELE
jgi:hypothetical protein